MNDTVIEFMREEIKERLIALPESNHKLFKRMYSPQNLDKDINKVVDDMPEEKLDWALSQVQKTVAKVNL